MKCKEHPRYMAMRMPVKTAKHPDGCPACWGIWERAKNDPKRLARTVNVELDPDEARAITLTLSRMQRTPAMNTLYQALARAVRDA